MLDCLCAFCQKYELELQTTRVLLDPGLLQRALQWTQCNIINNICPWAWKLLAPILPDTPLINHTENSKTSGNLIRQTQCRQMLVHRFGRFVGIVSTFEAFILSFLSSIIINPARKLSLVNNLYSRLTSQPLAFLVLNQLRHYKTYFV